MSIINYYSFLVLHRSLSLILMCILTRLLLWSLLLFIFSSFFSATSFSLYIFLDFSRRSALRLMRSVAALQVSLLFWCVTKTMLLTKGWYQFEPTDNLFLSSLARLSSNTINLIVGVNLIIL